MSGSTWTKITKDSNSFPKKSGLYLVTVSPDYCYWSIMPLHIWQFTTDEDCGVTRALCDGGIWYDFYDTNCGTPLAWMPLPEPWKGD